MTRKQQHQNMITKLGELLHEQQKLERLTNEQLVYECLKGDAADYPVVVEMMNRLYPQWWEVM